MIFFRVGEDLTIFKLKLDLFLFKCKGIWRDYGEAVKIFGGLAIKSPNFRQWLISFLYPICSLVRDSFASAELLTFVDFRIPPFDDYLHLSYQYFCYFFRIFFHLPIVISSISPNHVRCLIYQTRLLTFRWTSLPLFMNIVNTCSQWFTRYCYVFFVIYGVQT